MPDESTAHPAYAGTFRHSLDAKHRFAVPARWRPDREDPFYLMPAANDGNHLFALPPREFERIYESIQNNPRIEAPERRKFSRHFFSQAQHAVTDRQGRLLLPDEFCRQAGLTTELVLIGSYDRFEIWSPERWTAAQAAESATYQNISELIGL